MLKNLASKILSASPPSVILYPHTPSSTHWMLSRMDATVQSWALEKSDIFTKDEWNKIQLVKLKNLLIHAGTTVPYWQKVFKRVSFDPFSFSSIKELERIPILTRLQLKHGPLEEFISTKIPSYRLSKASTSGSTGEPLTFFQDKRDQFRRYVNTFQEFRYAIGEKYKRCKIVVIGLENHHDLDTIGIRYSLSDVENPTFRNNSIVPFFAVNSPILITTASILIRLYTTLKQDGRKNIQLTSIFYRGESINQELRNSISQYFSCETFTTYGSRECSLLGIECSFHTLHSTPWMNYIETLPNKNGSEDVIVTFLENYAIPFIRYKIGDAGTLTNKVCGCGRGTREIIPSGRIATLISIPTTTVKIPLLNLTRFVDENFSNRIYQYQFEKEGNKLIFRFVSNEDIGNGKQAIKEFLLEQFQRKIDVVILYVDEIKPEKNGKIVVFKETIV